MVKTIEYSAGITTVDFSEAHPYGASNRYYAVRNYGDSDIFVSASETCAEGTDGTKRVPAGECRGIDMQGLNVLYINAQGAGTAEIDTAAGISALGFNGGSKGGGSSGVVTANGNPVQLDGLQGGVPFNSVEVSGKNLITYPYYDGESKTMNGVTFTVNADGSVTANGTATARAFFHLRYLTEHLDFGLIPNRTYTFKACPSGASSSTYNASISVWSGEQFIEDIYDYGNGHTFIAKESTTHYGIAFAVEKNATVENVVFRPQLEYGSTPTAYEPPITGRELTVGVSGKNLLKNKLSTITSNGVTATINDDGSVTINRTASSELSSYLVLWNNIPARYVANQKIAINAINGQSLTTCYMGVDRLENGTYIDRIAVGLINNGVGMVTQEDVDNDRIFRTWIFINKDYAPNNLIVYPQLELGSTPTPYEPYHGAEYTITPDSNPYTVPVDITQQDGINVLSIADDSNPTISVSGNRASEQLGTIFRTLDNKPILLFDGTIPTSSSAGYAELTIDREYSMLLIAPVCNSSNVYSMGYCIAIPLNYIEEEEKAFSVDAFTQTSSTSSKAYIKRNGDTIYVRGSSTSCDHMTIYGI